MCVYEELQVYVVSSLKEMLKNIYCSLICFTESKFKTPFYFFELFCSEGEIISLCWLMSYCNFRPV